MRAEQLMTETLRAHPRGAQILAAALGAVEPGAAVRRALARSGSMLLVGEQRYDLAQIDRVVALAVGKAGAPMLAAAADALGDRLSAGLAVVKDGHAAHAPSGGRVEVIESGHPVPDARSVVAAERALGLFATLTERDLALVLISGGGSALLTMPVAGVSLADIQSLTRALLACGATINEINTLRKHLDRVKGGGLALAAGRARLAALVLSDVIGDPLDVIASGPTFPDPSTYADAWGVLERYGIAGQAPAPVAAHLRRGMAGEAPETLKPSDPRAARAQHLVIGSNRQAAAAAMAAAREAGMATLLLATGVQGEAREVGGVLAAIAREVAETGHPIPRPCCIVAGGETTVTLRGDGRGGRNQELALAAVSGLAGLPDVALVTLATDGGDGPTDAAGAVVTGATLGRAMALGMRPADYLARNDAYRFFEPLGDLLRPGPTQTNVNDLALLFAF
jgi:glycerate 2-kinase